MMRIAFLMQDTGVVYGAERATLDLVAGLKQAGTMVLVLLIEETRLNLRTSALRNELDQRGVQWIAIKTKRPFSWSLVRNIRRVLHDGKADILHTIGYKADWHGGLASKWGRLTPIVATVHGWLYGPDIKERIYRQLDVYALRRFDRVIVLSNFYHDLLIESGIPKNRLALIPSGIIMPEHTEALCADAQAEDKDRPITFGMLGRLSYEKNHAMLIAALNGLRESGVRIRCILAGEGPLRSSLATTIKNAGLEGELAMPGYIPSSSFFPQVDVLILCSRIENMPYCVLEAMAHGRPVIATRVGGVSDLVQDGETGYLVPLDDIHMLASRIKQLSLNPSLVCELGKAGRRFLESCFTLEGVISKHSGVYSDLLSEAINMRRLHGRLCGRGRGY